MKNINNITFFTLLGLSFIGLGFLALVLAMAGIFYFSIIFSYVILAGSGLIYLAIINRQNLYLNRGIFLVGLISLTAIILFSRFTVPSVFSGRDQGSLSNAAITLSQNHKLQYSFPAEKEFFKIYGPGEALNFSGFNYDSNGNLISHFPLGYISWLAVFYSFFGITGFIIANAVTFFIFLISFYLLAKNYLGTPAAFAAFFLVITSFVFSWFFKFSLSENLALFLVWFGLLQFIIFLKQKKERIFLLSFIASFGLLAFVRIETIAFVLVAAIIILISLKNEEKISEIIFNKKIFFALTAILILFLLSLKINSAFYITFLKGFFNSFGGTGGGNARPLSNIFYVFRVFSAYALLTYIIIAFLGIARLIKKGDIGRLIPFIILSPALIYIINPSISLDHPWMLRRYVFAVIPVCILYTVIFLDGFIRQKKYFYILVSFLIFTNLIIFFPYLKVKINDNLLGQTKNISSDFQKNDLILVDRMATGDPWSMMAGPLNLVFGKQAVYFFNPEDLEKLDLSQFEKTYFIIPDNNFQFYEEFGLTEKLVPVKDYLIENNSLEISRGAKKEFFYENPVNLPIYQKNYIYGKIYLLKSAN